MTSISSAGQSSLTYYPDGTIQTLKQSAPSVFSTLAGTTQLTPASNSNQITATSGSLVRTYAYDGAGDVLSDGTHHFTYNDAGRLLTETSGGLTTTYTYNVLGQRVRKSSATGTTLFVYDEVGHLLGEYDGSGNLIEEIVWMADIPIASIRPGQGGGIGVFYVHTDQLNAPTKLTRANDNAIVWRWDHDPFGNGAAMEDPDNNGQRVTFSLRFPGQYYDVETGLIYNGARYYDQQLGRYIESDPIGLRAGVNTYAYVGGNPISNKDPSGLMCVPGVGCYTTPAEAAVAQSGNAVGYYQLACAGGDAYACFAQHIAANDNWWGHQATQRLLDKLREAANKHGQCVNEDNILDQIRQKIALAYANYLPQDPAHARWPSADDIAPFHWDMFGQFGLPPSTFGGTPGGVWGGPVLPGDWCPNCTGYGRPALH